MVSISLVIPTYNRAALVAQTVQAALAQTRPFTEIIVVDDGSSDDTPQTLAGLAGRISVIRTGNAGVQAARNTGAAAASSEYLAFSDSDDLLEPTYVATMSGWLHSHPGCDIAYCNFTEFDAYGVSVDKFSEAPAGFFYGARMQDGFLVAIPDLYLRTTTFQPLYPTGMVLKKRFFETIGGYDPAFRGIGAEDYEFTLRAIAHGEVALCPMPLARIRKHAGNDSRDPLRQCLGEAKILEHGLAHHQHAAVHRTALLEAVRSRRLWSFDAAFARGDFPTVRDLLLKLGRHPRSLRFGLKKAISTLPAPLRGPVWRLSQRQLIPRQARPHA